ncbi:MAG: hypothetical protein U0793_32895 [Gemmataceae bacterium]
MRFFTPELYLRFNSSDEDEVVRAREEWEEAIARYRGRLATLRETMPSQVQKLTELCFHDAEIATRFADTHALPFLPPAPLWTAVAVFVLRNEDQFSELIYSLWDQVTEAKAPKRWRFSKERVHWLYDEIDQHAPGQFFSHTILLSDGKVVRVPFVSVIFHDLGTLTEKTASWQIA